MCTNLICYYIEQEHLLSMYSNDVNKYALYTEIAYTQRSKRPLSQDLTARMA